MASMVLTQVQNSKGKMQNEAESKFKEIIANFEGELKTIHTGRAHSGLVEDIKVNHYNSLLPLKQLASISIPSPQELLIRPFDEGALVPIETALREAGRNFNPTNDGTLIRVSLPPLSGERRLQLLKLVARQAESTRIALRNIREEIWRQVKQSQRQGKLTEDDKYRLEKELNDLIGQYNQKIDDLAQAKRQSIES